MSRLISPETRLRIIKLRVEDGLTYATIAERVALNKSTVAKILRAAKAEKKSGDHLAAVEHVGRKRSEPKGK